MYLDKTTGLTLPGAGGASGGGTDTTDATAKPGDVADGAVFYNADGKQTGTLKDAEVTGHGDDYGITFSPGILRKETHIGVMKYADDDEDIPDDGPAGEDNYFLLNDPDLRPKNIRKGVSVFGVTGNLEPGTTFYKCASVDANNKTWTGYKAILSDGAYSFEDAVTEGLIYGGGLTPAVKGIYTDGALIEVSKLYQGVYLPGIRIGASLSQQQAEFGNVSAVINGVATGVTFGAEDNGVYGALFSGAACCRFELGGVPEVFTAAVRCVATSGEGAILAVGNDAHGCGALWLDQESNLIHFERAGGGSDPVFVRVANESHHFVLSRSGSDWKIYVDGNLITAFNYSVTIKEDFTGIFIGGLCRGYTGSPWYYINGHYSNFQFYDRLLSDAEIERLASM